MWIRIRIETTVDLKTPLKKSNKKFWSKYYEVRPEPWVYFHQCPKLQWHVVDPERGAAAVGGTVGRRWEAVVGTAVDPERGAAGVGRRWGAVVGTDVVPPTR
jgi:hypothetical protein